MILPVRWGVLQRCAVTAVVVAAVTAAPSRAADSPAAVTVTAPAATTTATEADVAHWVDVARASNAGSSLPQRQVEAEVLQLLMSIAWIDGEATEQGITVTDAEVQKSFDEQRRQSFPKDADFQRFLRQTHQTVADILVRVRNDLLTDRIRDKATAPAAAAITDEVVDAAVRKAGPEVVPELRDIRFITAPSRAAARRALARHRGVLQNRVARKDLPARLGRVAFRAARGRLVGPLGGAHYFIVVVRIHPRHLLPLDKQRAEVRAKLVSGAEQKALDAFVTAFTAKWRARTTCAPAYVWDEDCGNWDGTPPPQSKRSARSASRRMPSARAVAAAARACSRARAVSPRACRLAA
jgi:foldase protein PrsA